MLCPVCNDAELTGRQKTCSAACRTKLSRIKDEPHVEPQVQEEPQKPSVLPAVHTSQDSESSTQETHAEWLARRMIESGSMSTIRVAVGYPPETAPRVQIPSRYESSDLDYAIQLIRKQKPKGTK